MNDELWIKVSGKGAGQFKDANDDAKRCKVKLNEDGTLNRLDVYIDKQQDGIHNHFYLNNETKESGYKKRR